MGGLESQSQDLVCIPANWVCSYSSWIKWYYYIKSSYIWFNIKFSDLSPKSDGIIISFAPCYPQIIHFNSPTKMISKMIFKRITAITSDPHSWVPDAQAGVVLARQALGCPSNQGCKRWTLLWEHVYNMKYQIYKTNHNTFQVQQEQH